MAMAAAMTTMTMTTLMTTNKSREKRLKRRQKRREERQQRKQNKVAHYTDYSRNTKFVPVDTLGYTIPFTASMTPAQLFIRLTATTCPNGFEHALYGPSLEAMGFALDGNGNYLAVIDGDNTRTMFTAHLDTIARTNPEVVIHKVAFDDGVPVRVETDKSTNLGADDKAGVVCLMALYNARVPGYYYLFHGEECGAMGSRDADRAEDWGVLVDRCISFDRRGYTSVITFQSGHRTASDTFAQALADAINVHGFQYKPDPTGVFTDSESFSDSIPECTNLSVGYDGAHTHSEMQNLAFLTELCQAIVKVDWESLPTARDPKAYEAKSWGSAGTGWTNGGYGKGGSRAVTWYNDDELFDDEEYAYRQGGYASTGEDDELPAANRNPHGQYYAGGQWHDFVPSKRGSGRTTNRKTHPKDGTSLSPAERLAIIVTAGVMRFSDLYSWVRAYPQAATQAILLAWEENPDIYSDENLKLVDVAYTTYDDDPGYNADKQFES